MDIERLESILSSIGIEIVKHGSTDLLACCPFHSENRPSWGISIHEPHYHGCFACGSKGTIEDLVTRIGGFDRPKAEKICGTATRLTDFPTFDSAESYVPEDDGERVIYPHTRSIRSDRYMIQQRGIPFATLVKCGIGHDRHNDRVMIPWYMNDRFLGYTGRALVDGDDVPKVLPYAGLTKKNALYLPSRTILPRPLYLVEGEIDALKVFAYAEKNVGALGHGRFTAEVAQFVVFSAATSIVMFYDNDKAGRRLMYETFKAIGKSLPVWYVDYTGKDPAELNPTYLRWCMRNSRKRYFLAQESLTRMSKDN